MPDIRSLIVENDSANGQKPPAPIDGRDSAKDDVTAGVDSSASTHKEFDLKPPLLVMKGTTPADFLISWRDQPRHSVVPHKVTWLLWGGAAMSLVSISVFAHQLGWL
jgi:hypothetical protein